MTLHTWQCWVDSKLCSIPATNSTLKEPKVDSPFEHKEQNYIIMKDKISSCL